MTATYALADGVAVITMDDGKANAVSLAMQQALNECLDRADADAAAVVLAGRPGMFSAGFDLKTISAGGQDAVDMLHGGLTLAIRLLTNPRPVVAACTGHAVAMGVFLLLSCDYRIGTNGSHRISANEVAIGMTMPHSTIEILRQRVTPAALNRAVLFAETFHAGNAIETGFLDEVIDEGNVLSRAVEHASVLAALDARAHATSKARLRADTIRSIRDGLALDDNDWKKLFLPS